MIWREGGDMPTVIIKDWHEAMKAANGLARKNQGARFHVLRTTRIIERQPKKED